MANKTTCLAQNHRKTNGGTIEFLDIVITTTNRRKRTEQTITVYRENKEKANGNTCWVNVETGEVIFSYEDFPKHIADIEQAIVNFFLSPINKKKEEARIAKLKYIQEQLQIVDS